MSVCGGGGQEGTGRHEQLWVLKHQPYCCSRATAAAVLDATGIVFPPWHTP